MVIRYPNLPEATMDKLRVLGIAGSIRKGSYNQALLRAAAAEAPENMHIEIYEGLRQIPPYDNDVHEEGDPAVVRTLKELVRAADGLLIATPEYNYGIPGVLKNAIDWVSRPPNPMDGKPTAIMGASISNFGTVRAQMSLRQTFIFTNNRVMARPELMVFNTQQRFSEAGELTDDDTRKFLREFLESFAGWIEENAPRPVMAGSPL
jgi:chromate reductase